MLYFIFIPLGLLFIPWLLVRFVFSTASTKKLPYKKYVGYLWTASVTWLLAMTLPNIPLTSQTDTLTMHLGGGVVAALMFVYATKVYAIKFEYLWQKLISLYFFVSALAVLNELLEFFLDSFTPMKIEHGDEWWDLLAGVVGGFVAYGILLVIEKLRK